MLALDERFSDVGELLDARRVRLDLLLEVLVFLHLSVQVGRVLRPGGETSEGGSATAARDAGQTMAELTYKATTIDLPHWTYSV